MRSRRTQYKNQNRLFFCTLCSYVANSEEELESHYVLAHDEDNDVSYELEFITSKEKKAKTLKEKAIEQLKLLVERKIVHNEYLGYCEIPYYLVVRHENGVTKIELEQGMWIC